MNTFVGALGEVAAAFPRLVRLVCRWLADLKRRGKREEQPLPCLPIPAGVWLRPDAYLYSQRYLMSLGLAVTWDNPDVTLLDMAGKVVGSHDLAPSTPYRVIARIHNRSPDAPAPKMPVVFRLISFGAGGPSKQTIGTVPVDLPVRAGPGEPAIAEIVWTTPPVPDHYCIEIEAVWADDAFPPDNVGQHNTVVRGAHPGERPRFHVPVFNRLREDMLEVVAHVDGYRLPERPLLRNEQEDHAALFERVKLANALERFPADANWQPTLSPAELRIEPGEKGEVVLDLVVPADAPLHAEKRFNVSIRRRDGSMLGGATVIVRVE